MLSSIINTTEMVSLQQILICSSASMILGVLVSYIYMYKNSYNKNFTLTLAILPLLVQSVIMLVNGNLGTGVAVLGAFSLIRFRSVAGGSREIASIFWAMGIGLATGMGYIQYVVIFSIMVAIFYLALTHVNLGKSKRSEREIRITISESLDYPELFDDIFAKYTTESELERVKTVNMGSLYELRYNVWLKNIQDEKKMLDAIRTRNGNLTVSSGKVVAKTDEL